MAKLKNFTCCICGKEFVSWSGNDPWPVVVDDEESEIRPVCCRDCDWGIVIPARARMKMASEADSNN